MDTHKVVPVVLGQDKGFDREILSQSLTSAGEFQVVSQASTTQELLKTISSHAPPLVILRADLPGSPDARLLRRLKEACPSSRILMVLCPRTSGLLQRVVTWGAEGVVSIHDGLPDFIYALRTVYQRGAYISPRLTMPLMQRMRGQMQLDLHEALSPREFEVMRRLCAGERVGVIADAMHLSIKTVSTYKVHLMEKLGVTSVPDLVRYGIEHQLTPSPQRAPV